MNHYTHLYGSTVTNANHIRRMVNLMLDACVRYPLYIIIYCKQSPLHHYLTSVEFAQAHPNNNDRYILLITDIAKYKHTDVNYL